jgi:putative transposase
MARRKQPIIPDQRLD